MISAIVLASLAVGASAQTQDTGLPSCPCIGTTGGLPDSIAKFDCGYDWACNGKCVNVQIQISIHNPKVGYPGCFGETCKVHKEPGHKACFDQTTVPPTEKALADQAEWCKKKWCFVDPCACDASEVGKSDYFHGLHYSSVTCGDTPFHVASVGKKMTENSKSECSNEEEKASNEASDAHSVKMGLGFMLAGMGALA